MCMQCVVDARVVAPVVPGWILMVSMKDHQHWPLGQLALVERDDPTYYLLNLDSPVPNPVFGMSEEWKEIALEDAEIDRQYDEFLDQLEFIRSSLCGDLLSAHRLVESCKKAGFNGDIEDVYEWLMHRIAYLFAKNSHKVSEVQDGD